MSGVHLVAVDNQKVFVITADVAIRVPEDGEYTLSDTIYAAVLQQISDVEGTTLAPGDYSVILTATATIVPEDEAVAEEPNSNQLELPLDTE